MLRLTPSLWTGEVLRVVPPLTRGRFASATCTSPLLDHGSPR